MNAEAHQLIFTRKENGGKKIKEFVLGVATLVVMIGLTSPVVATIPHHNNPRKDGV